MDRNSYIAVFDSGVGGVSVLRELRKQMPLERFYYFGDSANAPYGLRSTQEVKALTIKAAKHLLDEKDAKALVVACNTATAAAIDDLRLLWPDRIIIGIEPALKLARDRHPGGTIGIMATEVTLREKKLSALMERYSKECAFLPLHSPGIVELVESGRANSQESLALMEAELGHFRGKLDALVLGCTHYPFMKPAIRAVLGSNVDILDGGEGTARETQRRLAQADLLSEGPGGLEVENSSTDPAKIQLTLDLLNTR